MSSIKIIDLPELTSITRDDLFIVADSGNPYTTKKMAWKNIDAPSGYITYGRRNQQWVDLTTPANLQIRRGTANEVSGIIPLEGEPVWTTDTKNLTIGDGSSYGGLIIGLQDTDRYIFCTPKDGIANKYNIAKSLNPGGNVKSSGNRATMIVMPGIYNEPSGLDINAEFVDILGLGSIKKHRGCECSVYIPSGIVINANDVKVIGLETSTLQMSTNKPLQIIENCKARNDGGFDCQQLDGTYINCEATNASFGISVYGALYGKFHNCKAGNDSFGGEFYALAGEFINCEAGDRSFGGLYGSIASGVFENCVAGSGSFGGGEDSVSAGLFLSCRLTSGSFNPPTNGGKYRYCIDGNNNTYNNP